jgi:hypothetical protein
MKPPKKLLAVIKNAACVDGRRRHFGLQGSWRSAGEMWARSTSQNSKMHFLPIRVFSKRDAVGVHNITSFLEGN